MSGHDEDEHVKDTGLEKPFIPLTDREAEIHNYTYKKAWNAAIEAAAKSVDNSETNLTKLIAYDIRKLKK